MPPRTPSGATPLRWVTPRRLSPLDQRQKWHGWRCGLHADSRRLRRAHRPVRWRHVGTHVRTSRRRRLLDSRHRTTSSRSRTVCRSVLKDGETAPKVEPHAVQHECSSLTTMFIYHRAHIQAECRRQAQRVPRACPKAPAASPSCAFRAPTRRGCAPFGVSTSSGISRTSRPRT